MQMHTADRSVLLETAPRRARWPRRNWRVTLYATMLLFDLSSMVAGFQLASLWRDQPWLGFWNFALLFLALPLFTMLLIGREAQAVITLERLQVSLSRLTTALVATAVALVLVLFFFKISADISRTRLVIFFVVTGILAGLARAGICGFVYWFLGGNVTSRLIIADGVPLPYDDAADSINLELLGLTPNLSRPGSLDAISAIVADYDSITVICADKQLPVWATFLRGSDVGGEVVVEHSRTGGAVAIGRCGDQPTLIFSRGPLSLTSRMLKRLFDLSMAIPIIFVLLPVMLVVALAIRFESRGPVLFRQTRVGQGNRQFSILKFRSMYVDAADQAGSISASRTDPRITRVGAFIRATSIDELPQLLNVLRGEMSLVGPRPHALGSLAGDALFWEVSQKYWMRHALKPGITGLAQIRGYRGATDQPADLTNRLEADLEYVSNWSLATDARILLATLRVLVHDRAY